MSRKNKDVKYVQITDSTVEEQVLNTMRKKGYGVIGGRYRTVKKGIGSVEIHELKFEKPSVAIYRPTGEKLGDITEIKKREPRDSKAEIHTLGE